MGLGLALGGAALAQQYSTTVEIAVKDKKFEPAEVKAPANQRIVIHVTNRDAAAMEFESKALKVEKIIAANAEGNSSRRAAQARQVRVLRRFQPVQSRHVDCGGMRLS